MHSQVSERRFDLSRDTFDATKLYRSIVRQQGRVTVDADDNEQRRIELHRSDLTTLDVIGPAGYPEGGAGFLITVASGGQLLDVGLGRMYVHGMLVENFTASPQLLLDSTTGGPPQLLTVSSTGTYEGLPAGTYLAYLDVWERDITALDDPNIRETALGGPDTAARTELVAQVHLTPVATGATCASATIPVLPDHLGTLTAGTDPAAAAQDCSLPPLAGFRGAENQLYRVEIHTSGAPGTATFKWSRENGSVVTGITGASTGMVGGSFTVQSLGADSTLGFAVNEWVELIDDDVVMTGGTGWLALIGNIDPGTLTVTLSASSPTGVIAYGKNPKIRRWDQTDTTAINGVLTATTPVDLENGVQVSFGGSMLYAGDYWMIPARTAIDEETGTLDYPATPQTASYSAHNDASLAVIAFDTSTGWGTPSDCRVPFPPLTGLPKATAGCCTTVTVGDGVTSFGDFTDIGAAIAGLPSGGGVVGIEAGTYSIATPIVVPANVTLRGCPGQSIIQAQAGAFIVEGDDVSITGLRFEISTGAAVATRPAAAVSNLIVLDNVVLSKTSGATGSALYGFSFSADTANVTGNTLTSCGIEVQPVSSNVTITANDIESAGARGVSIGTQSAAAPAATGFNGFFQYFAFASVDEINHAASTGGTTVTSSIVTVLDITGNTIVSAALEGIGAESFILQTNDDGTAVAQQTFACEDVTVAENRISNCLLGAAEAKVPASAAVLFPIVERFKVLRNTIDGNGSRIAASGIASALALGSEIRENRILQNGAGAKVDDTYGIAAIELFIAMQASPNSTQADGDIELPAAIIADNIVTSPNAPALFIMAVGQVSITNNDFTAVGYVDNSLAPGQCVVVMDFGTGAQEQLTFSGTTGINLTHLAGDAQSFSTDGDVSGGQVLFSGNRCLYDGRDTGEAPTSSITILSEDGILVDGNQSRCFVQASSQSGSAGTLGSNLLGLALVAQVSGNRFSEDSASASALVYGADTVAIGNHGTHCLFFVGQQGQVDKPNLVNSGFSEACAALEKRVFSK
jgi:Family of unknown function (DUF6519)